jgi:hypothetical protein
MTANEIQAARVHGQNYWLYLVAGCLAEAPKVQTIQNPAAKLNAGEWSAMPTLFAVRFGGRAREIAASDRDMDSDVIAQPRLFFGTLSPGPSPFSSMKIAPCASSAARIAVKSLSKGRCQSNRGSSTCGATAISRAAIYAARARHSAKAAERLCL